MSALAICRPLPLAIGDGSSAGVGLSNLLSGNPREPFVAASAGATTIALDLGVEQLVDTFFLGYTNAAAAAPFTVSVDGAVVHTGTFSHSYRSAPVMRHAAAVLPGPVLGRHVRLVATTTAPLVAGVAAAGHSLQIEGHDWGSGRPVTDSGRVERLLFGMGAQAGSVAGGWAWTMPVLDDEEAERLYALKLDTGATGAVLVLEHSDNAAPAFNEAIHWGKLTKLEPWSRQTAGETKWSMQVQDW